MNTKYHNNHRSFWLSNLKGLERLYSECCIVKRFEIKLEVFLDES